MSIDIRPAATPTELEACFPVMHALRPHLKDESELVMRIQSQAGQGYRLLAAWRGTVVIGAAGYRMQENLIRGRFCYVDDLVVAETERRGGLGARLLDAVAVEARRASCLRLTLDRAGQPVGATILFPVWDVACFSTLRHAIGLIDEKILYISCSPRGPASHSLTFAEEVLERLRQHHPGAAVRRRDLAADSPCVVDAAFSNAVLVPASPPTAFVQSETLIRELEFADAVVIATPMQGRNVGGPSGFCRDCVRRTVQRCLAERDAGTAGFPDGLSSCHPEHDQVARYPHPDA